MATAKATLVCIALDERKAVPVPDAFRQQIAALDDPVERGSHRPRGRRSHDGVTRYASNTASRLRSAVSSVRSPFTSPTSAVYQFFASWSSTTPP